MVEFIPMSSVTIMSSKYSNISVVIPLFNKAPHIARALNSVLNQTLGPKEIIVVDDGSTDGGGEIVKQFIDPRIKLFHQENQGVSVARNLGIDQTQGELIAFLDADDAWKPRFLETILSLQHQFPEAGIFATAYEKIMPDGAIEKPIFTALPPGCKQGLIDNYFLAAFTCPVWTSAVAIPKKILQEINGFQITEVQGEDIDAWLRIAFRYFIAWSSDYLSCYYMDAVNRADGFKLWKTEPAISRTARNAIASGLIPHEKIPFLKEYVAGLQVGAACDCLISGKKQTARALLQYSRGTRKYARKWWKYRLLAAIPGNPYLFLYKTSQLIRKIL